MDKIFNIVISGVGGQGLITLLNLVSQAALDSGYDVKTSELHGLSQRGGSVEVYIRFGPKVLSPMIMRGRADLIFALEEQEALNGAQFASKTSVILVNKYQTPTLSETKTSQEVQQLLKGVSKNISFIPVSEICQKELGTDVVSGVYLLGYAVHRGCLPLKPEIIKEAIKKTMPEKFWELNMKAFELAKNF